MIELAGYAPFRYLELPSDKFKAAMARELAPEQTVVLLLGPSGVGKSTLIRQLVQNTGSRFAYPRTFVERPLRHGETDKRQVTRARMNALALSGQLIGLNSLPTGRTATSRIDVDRSLATGKTPILDYGLRHRGVFQDEGYDELCVYVRPALDEDPRHVLEGRLLGDRRLDPDKLEDGLNELEVLELTNFLGPVDLVISNPDGKVTEVAQGLASVLGSVIRP